jgi:hypothetical protein
MDTHRERSNAHSATLTHRAFEWPSNQEQATLRVQSAGWRMRLLRWLQPRHAWREAGPPKRCGFEQGNNVRLRRGGGHNDLAARIKWNAVEQALPTVAAVFGRTQRRIAAALTARRFRRFRGQLATRLQRSRSERARVCLAVREAATTDRQRAAAHRRRPDRQVHSQEDAQRRIGHRLSILHANGGQGRFAEQAGHSEVVHTTSAPTARLFSHTSRRPGSDDLISTRPDHADKAPPARCTVQDESAASPGRARRTLRLPPRRTPPRSSRRTHPAASRGRTQRR